MTLEGKSVAILIAPRGTEEPEFSKPKQAVEDAGGKVTVVSFEPGKARTVNSDLDEGGSYTIDKTFSEVKADDFDGLLFPEGLSVPTSCAAASRPLVSSGLSSIRKNLLRLYAMHLGH